ncbi:Uu.00g097040.m01.CDS01 [Anthostomella pinea]|uniref:Uu.00g097040.m01.CDS01 n=1 Tax=Anthostomella pinea TaxID=933095 RepID=A0AAI8VCB1_9PEZI|nr:Uu.00g097040.m01.CDS01 [Anthostomella pinea]
MRIGLKFVPTMIVVNAVVCHGPTMGLRYSISGRNSRTNAGPWGTTFARGTFDIKRSRADGAKDAGHMVQVQMDGATNQPEVGDGIEVMATIVVKTSSHDGEWSSARDTDSEDAEKRRRLRGQAVQLLGGEVCEGLLRCASVVWRRSWVSR